MTLTDIKQKTPCFIVDEQLLDENFAEFKAALARHWDHSIVGYSCKTNSLPWILHHLSRQGIYAEVVSDTEYLLAQHLGFSKNHMIFNGPIKSREMMLDALRGGAIVNIDSKRELAWLSDFDKEGIPAGIGVRVNFDLEAVCPEESLTDGGGNRFGYNVENGDFGRVVSHIADLSNVHIAGLHMHTNSKTRSLKVFEALSEKVCQLADDYGLNVSFIDIGGSFFARKREYDAYENYARTIAGVLRQRFDPGQTALIVEPGSAVISTPVQYLTRVLDVKDTHRNRFVITDGGRLHIDAFMRKSSYVHELLTAHTASHPEQIICGYTCMETDRFMTLKDAPELKADDYIIYDLVGGYTMALNAQFIEYYPNVFVRHTDGSYECVREKWGLTEYLQKNIW